MAPFSSRMIGACDDWIDVLPNWSEADPVRDWRGRAAMPSGDG
jgi:hypothetical protein